MIEHFFRWSPIANRASIVKYSLAFLLWAPPCYGQTIAGDAGQNGKIHSAPIVIPFHQDGASPAKKEN